MREAYPKRVETTRHSDNLDVSDSLGSSRLLGVQVAYFRHTNALAIQTESYLRTKCMTRRHFRILEWVTRGDRYRVTRGSTGELAMRFRSLIRTFKRLRIESILFRYALKNLPTAKQLRRVELLKVIM